MCTLVVLHRPDHPWPILLAANRDEKLERPWLPPAAHWPDRPDIIAGMDELAGGSWLGINASGVVAAVLNREGTLGPESGKRSRGELVLDALDYADALDAAEALGALDVRAYRPFNLFVADNRDAFLLSHRGATEKSVAVEPLPEGLTMITALERDDPSSPRIRLYRPRFVGAVPPDPDAGDWASWEALLASRDREPDAGPGGALFIDPVPGPVPSAESGLFGTVSSSLIALPAVDRPGQPPIWRFADGPPERWAWREIPLF
jgi:hypothetical protein